MKEHYEDYWNRPNTYAEPDPLAGERAAALWDCIAKAGTSPTSLLDVGCGEGNLVATAIERGLSASGIDISDQAVLRARTLHPGANFTAHSVESLPWPVSPGSFEVIASFEVIEHLMHPAALIQGSYTALATGGYLALSTPFHGLIKNLALSLLSFDKHFAVEGDHIRFFTDAALRKILGANGFRVIEIRHFGRGRGIWANTFVWSQKI